MDPIIAKILEQTPAAAAIIVVAYLFLKAEAARDIVRIEHTKELEDKREKHEREINNMWATMFSQLSRDIVASQAALMKAIENHEQDSQQRYKRLNITNKIRKANQRS